MMATDATLTAGAEPAVRLSGVAVDDEVLGLLGVRPVLGRWFEAGDAEPGGPAVILLGEGLWRSRFGGDASVLGRTVTLDGLAHTVVGVLPAEADLGIAQVHARADYSVPFQGPRVDVWLPLQASEAQYPRQTHPFLTVGRLAPGATLEQAQRELASIAATLEAAFPENEARGVNLEAFERVVFGPVRPALLVLLGAVGFVLLITCANVGNLLLARTIGRVREVAMRRALGAATGRVARQFLVESLVLTALATVLAIVLAWRGVNLIVALAPADVPRLGQVGVDLRVLGFTAGVGVLVAIAFGMIPVAYARRLDLQRFLREQPGPRVSEGAAGRRFRSALVVVEVALAVSLVIGTGLVLRSFWSLRGVDPGFVATGVLKAEYQLPAATYPTDYSNYPDWPRISGFHAALLREVRSLPGVRSAALSARHPLDAGFTNSFLIVGREAESADFPEIRTRMVSPDYLRTLAVPLLAGRDLREGDDATAPPVVLVNRAAVDRYFAGGDALGREIRFWGFDRRIVGVIGNEKFSGLANDAEPAVYAPRAQAPQARVALLVRADTDPRTLAGPVRTRVSSLDADVALHGVEPLDVTLSRSIAEPRFTAVLLTLFGGLAVVLALGGVYGVLSYAVTQRTREVGIRVALGASRGGVIGMVVRHGMRLALAGIVIGLLGAAAGTRLLGGLLFGVSATDAMTFATVVAGVAMAALAATVVPALRATRVTPMTALRAE
jgi:predicted permease